MAVVGFSEAWAFLLIAIWRYLSGTSSIVQQSRITLESIKLTPPFRSCMALV